MQAESVQPWRLQEARAVARFDARLHGLAVAIDRHRHFKPRRPERPHPAVKLGEIANLGAGHRQQNVAGAEIRLLRRTVLGEADDNHPILDRGRVEPEPWTRWSA